jgi:two-component system, cell cycle response regulator DivK
MAKKTKTVLIVEDDPLNLKLFRDLLRARGYDSIEDRIGKHCLDYAKLYQPDLIILDVSLPYSSGIELARALKAQTTTAHIPLIGVTALAISDTHQEMREAGCIDCLTKPFTLDQFLKVIDRALRYSIDISEHKKSAFYQGALLNQAVFMGQEALKSEPKVASLI